MNDPAGNRATTDDRAVHVSRWKEFDQDYAHRAWAGERRPDDPRGNQHVVGHWVTFAGGWKHTVYSFTNLKSASWTEASNRLRAIWLLSILKRVRDRHIFFENHLICLDSAIGREFQLNAYEILPS